MTEATVPNGDASVWPILEIPASVIREAKSIRRDRENSGGPLYAKAENRWLGEVGAMMVGRWLRSVGLSGQASWLRREQIWRPDYLIEGQAVRVRSTLRRSVVPSDFIGINIRRKRQQKHEQIFVAIDPDATYATIVGAMAFADVMARGTIRKGGDALPTAHGNAVLPDGTDLIDVQVRWMTPVDEWVCARMRDRLAMCPIARERVIDYESYLTQPVAEAAGAVVEQVSLFGDEPVKTAGRAWWED